MARATGARWEGAQLTVEKLPRLPAAARPRFRGPSAPAGPSVQIADDHRPQRRHHLVAVRWWRARGREEGRTAAYRHTVPARNRCGRCVPDKQGCRSCRSRAGRPSPRSPGLLLLPWPPQTGQFIASGNLEDQMRTKRGLQASPPNPGAACENRCATRGCVLWSWTGSNRRPPQCHFVDLLVVTGSYRTQSFHG